MKMNRRLSLLLIFSLYLGISRGHLAIFSKDDAQPLQILPYDAAIFSEADRQALEKGIPFSTVAELSRLLEDYTS